MDTYLTTKEVAALLKISYDKALQLMSCEELGAIRIGRSYRVTERRLNAFLYPTEEGPVQKRKLKKDPRFIIRR